MTYSYKALRELSKKYRSVLRKCAMINAVAVLGLMPLAANAANITCTAGQNCDIASGNTAYLNQNMTMTGTLTGDGELAVVPSNLENGKHGDVNVIWEGSIADFTGTIRTTQYSNGVSGGNAIPTLTLKNWSPEQEFKFTGNGIVVFDGNNSVKIVSSVDSQARMYLNNNTLDTSSHDVTGIILLGTQNKDENGRTATLDGYNLPNATIFNGGSNNTVNGDVNTTIKNSTFDTISGNGDNTSVNGNIILNVDNSTAAKINGNVPYNQNVNSLVNGDITVNVTNSNVSNTIAGQNFKAFGSTDAGTTGTITVNVKDTTVAKGVRGSNLTNAVDTQWIKDHYKTGDIIINLENATVGEEVIAAGSFVPVAGDVTINLKGDNTIGYDAAAGDGVLRAGTKRGDAAVRGNSTINIDTTGGHTVKVRDAIIAGSETAGSVQGNAILNLINNGAEAGIVETGSFLTTNVNGKSTLNLANVKATAANEVNGFNTINVDDRSVLTTKTLTMNQGDALNITLSDSENYGKVNAETINANNADLNLIVKKAGTYEDVIKGNIASNFKLNQNNALYNLSSDGRTVTAEMKSGVELAQSLGTEVSQQEANILVALAGLNGQGTEKGNQLGDAISTALQTGAGKSAVQAVKDLAPTNSQVVSGIARENNRMLENAVAHRLHTPSGMNSGDMFGADNVWVEGLYNHAKQDGSSSTDGFSAETKGVAFGLDGMINNCFRLGMGYSYLKTDADSGSHDIDAKGHNVFVYGTYQPSQWYMDGMLSYGWADYKDHTRPLGISLKGKYDVDTYAANLIAGYDMKNGFAPQIGARYLHIEQDSYNDGVQHIKAKDNDILTAVAGVKFAKDYQSEAWTLTPKARLAATYDIMSDKTSADVNIIGAGAGNYHINGKRLNRFGVEGSIGLAAAIDNWELSAEYAASVRKDYQSHAGLFNLKYNF
ncbi:MAG: autotransporter domain-containing protein [Acetobacter sp.]|nr:autotransporter domain-containing protein [Acetobacter sp.]